MVERKCECYCFNYSCTKLIYKLWQVRNSLHWMQNIL